uniref:Fe2OG dioxygenase domain-containing protein n=1 Tax=Kalanchoe fedtschenkoi TaxID=63787 RepID=A0A7N0T440_KALFE
MGEMQPVRLGGTLKVPIVQELAKKALSELPPRYAHPGQEPAANASAEEVPVIDFQKLLSDESTDSELLKLHTACTDWGFFQLVGHGVSGALLERVKAKIQEFFELPVEEKEKYEQLPDDVEGYGQAFVKSDEQKLDWADMFYMITLPVNMRKPHLLPKLPPPLRDAIEEYSSELKGLSMKLLDFLSKALKMEFKEFEDFFEEGVQSMRFNYYPPCPQPELAIGITPHSDPVGFTVLLQINDKEGLEIRKDVKWVPVKPISNAFVFNIGDVLEIVSNGAYRSIEHRAVVNSEKERLSLATFFIPRLDAEIAPSSSIVTPENPARFRKIINAELLKRVYAKELEGKSQLEMLRI